MVQKIYYICTYGGKKKQSGEQNESGVHVGKEALNIKGEANRTGWRRKKVAEHLKGYVIFFPF